MHELGTALGGRYEVVSALGHGGMATVYLARDLKHDREVALKVLRPDVGEALTRDRFLREIRLAARLNHPHILPLYDSGEAGGFLYFTMPVMRGQTLRRRLEAGPLPVDEAVTIAAQVADALDHAHRQDIVHRDVKPENILLHEGHAIVADFGIGKALVAAGGASQAFTQVGLTVGTPAYMSPEQAAGSEVDGRSDLFALGCVLYEMLTGEVAFSGPTVQATIARRFTHTPAPAGSRRAGVPRGVDAAIARLLEKDAEARFTSGSEAATALRTPAAVPAQPTTRQPEAPARKAIVVLPFANLSPDPDNEYFTEGLTEELIADLSGIHALRVISSVSAMQYKGTTKAAPEIGRELGVEYVLAGSVRRAGQALRITAQLTDAADNTQRWAGKYNGTMDDVFDLQERVSRAIVEALRVQLSTSESARLSSRLIRDPRAFELYLQARLLVRRYGTPLDRVGALLSRAVAIEGNTPPLRALQAYMLIAQVRAGMSTSHDQLDRADAEGRALIELAPDEAYGYSIRGFVGYERGDQWAAVRFLGEALERDGTDQDAWFFRGIAYQGAGQVEECLEVSRRFLEVDPLSPMASLLAGASTWFAGRATEGVHYLRQAVAADPENPILHWSLGYAATMLDARGEAAAALKVMRERVPTMPYTLHLASLLASMDGRKDEGLALVAPLRDTPFDAHITFHLAEAFAMAGDMEGGLDCLARAVEAGFHPVDYIERYCPCLAPLRGHPRFPAILGRARERTAEFRRRAATAPPPSPTPPPRG